jgi:hypothetical protein
MRAALTLLPVIALFAAIAAFSYSSGAQKKPLPCLLRLLSMGLLFLGGLVFLPAFLVFLSQAAQPGLTYAEPQVLSVWLLVGALLLGTGLLIHVGRFSLKVLLCLVLMAAVLSSLPVLIWGD